MNKTQFLDARNIGAIYMCGIIGVIGQDAPSLVVHGLKMLEYRGYDSSGVAVISEGTLEIRKNTGKLEEVEKKEKFSELNGNISIGHNRWCTHGAVTKENSHPHTDCTESIAVVHNGIIENYLELKEKLIANGHSFKTQTDTEIVPHLIEEKINAGKNFETAVKETCNKLEGRFAIVVVKKDEKQMIGARRGSPLVMGIGDGKYFLASDVPAFLSSTRKVIFLEDNEMAVIGSEAKILNFKTNVAVQRQVQEISWTAEEAEKGEYPHYLIKEIMEQGVSLHRAVNQDETRIKEVAQMINAAFGTYIVGCGTAGKVGLAGTYIFSKVAKKHINFAIGSEFPQYHDFLTPKSLTIAISQSGETADTLEAMEATKETGGKLASIVNVMGSTMQRMSDGYIMVNAGPEKAVASTKATTGQLAILYLLAFASAGKLPEGKQLLDKTCGAISGMLNKELTEKVKTLANKLKSHENIYIIGRGLNYPIALEAAIKLQEVSYIHAEGFAGGELKHGPLALITKDTPCIVLVGNDETRKDVLSNAREIKARGGYIIGISPENSEVFDEWIQVPDVGICSPIVNIIPIQLLAYFIGVEKGNDIDRCRNLAKAVTVK
ncbi:MAG: glutamine--fructose-6-phosphate transaminase (isomerizing) [Candidatus Micrarchaeota archaeon]|nr:glutamine--fructose-6-phosphate transaminase (isomerizing) [Candidatus Micrarchaeota archaeon]